MTNLFGSIQRLERLLEFHLERHAVLSANIANVDTPGYVARDTSFADALGEATAGLARTAPGHVAAPAPPPAHALVFDDPAPDGDRGAALEREMSKVSANAIRYEMAAEMVRRKLAMLRYAASDGGTG